MKLIEFGWLSRPGVAQYSTWNSKYFFILSKLTKIVMRLTALLVVPIAEYLTPLCRILSTKRRNACHVCVSIVASFQVAVTVVVLSLKGVSLELWNFSECAYIMLMIV